MAKDHRSRDQKRKAKLKKRAERSRTQESLAYRGTKYQTSEYVPVIYKTELGIFQTHLMYGRRLTDNDVEGALESLILQLRQGELAPFEPGEAHVIPEDDREAQVIWNIRRGWEHLADEGSLPRRDDLVGILRTILGSLETWRGQSMHPQAYLRFLEGFMGQTGLEVKFVKPDPEPLDVEEDSLLELGRDWIETRDENLAELFTGRITELMQSGEARRAVAVCQQLIGEAKDPAIAARLDVLAGSGCQLMLEQG